MADDKPEIPEVGAAFSNSQGYHYVLREVTEGLRTIGTVRDRASFEQWYAGIMKDGSGRAICDTFEIIEEGISLERAEELTGASAAERFCASEQALSRAIFSAQVDGVLARRGIPRAPVGRD